MSTVMNAHKNNMSALINMSAWLKTTRSCLTTARANKPTLYASPVCLQSESAKLEEAIWRNLEELGL